MHAIFYVNALPNNAYVKEKFPKGFYADECHPRSWGEFWLKTVQQANQESMPCFVGGWGGGVCVCVQCLCHVYLYHDGQMPKYLQNTGENDQKEYE